MKKLKIFFKERLKTSTKFNLVTLGLLAVTLLLGNSVKTFIGLAFTPNQPAINIILFTLIAGWYVLLTFVAGSILVKVTRRRLHERNQGWLEDPIPADHGSTLREVIQALRTEPVEYLAYFSPSGEKLVENTMRRPDQVGLTYQQRQLIRQHPGCISVHNHPGERITAFSSEDVKIALDLHESQSIVVAEDICFIFNHLDGVDVQPSEVVSYMRNIPTGRYEVMLGAGQELFSYLMSDRLDELSVMRCAAIAEKFSLEFKAEPTNEMIAEK